MSRRLSIDLAGKSWTLSPVNRATSIHRTLVILKHGCSSPFIAALKVLAVGFLLRKQPKACLKLTFTIKGKIKADAGPEGAAADASQMITPLCEVDAALAKCSSHSLSH